MCLNHSLRLAIFFFFVNLSNLSNRRQILGCVGFSGSEKVMAGASVCSLQISPDVRGKKLVAVHLLNAHSGN